MKKISMIIPVSEEVYLEDYIKTLQMQNYHNLEMIFVQNGCKEMAREIIEKNSKKDSRIRFLKQEEQDICKARQLGVMHATGEYVLFLDDTTWLHNHGLKIAMEEVEKSQADIVFWGFYKYTKKKRITCKRFGNIKMSWENNQMAELLQQMVGPEQRSMQEWNRFCFMMPVWGKLYRRELLENIEYQNDELLWNIQVFSKVKKAVYLPFCISYYKKNRNKVYQPEVTGWYRDRYRHLYMELQKRNYWEQVKDAWKNRIGMGLICIGISLVQAKDYTFKEKREELERIAGQPQYRFLLQEKRKEESWLLRLFYQCITKKRYRLSLVCLYFLTVIQI